MDWVPKYWAAVDVVHQNHTGPLLEILTQSAWGQRATHPCPRATIVSVDMSQAEAFRTLWQWRAQLGCRGLNYRVLPADPT